ncbi:oxidoreductase [Actinoplanes capillaceus]|uniref:Oxidoreductase n=2 Tax=Actinoplanes campanulatus TaxID=113559 RepID=A0ABQ3WQB4_9ACTN|nr:oxidoreductase [Actinoplanes capillaceus]
MGMKALISGAGVAGPTLAFWLVRHGWQVTLVERAAGLRAGGNPVDVRGPAVAVAERMGILPRLRAAATHASAMRVLDPHGRPIARIAMPSRGGEVEIPRSDLATILAGAVRDDAELILDDTITAMRQEPGGVEVTFERAAPRRFDLVVGADGLHSTVRRLAFGPESRFVRPIGLGVATVPLGEPAEDPDEVLLFNTPGRLVSIHPARGSAVAAFIFRSERISREGLAAAYAGSGWRVPALLELAVSSDELFLDPVSRVSLPAWSSGRVTLLGDAASSLSLLGDGSTLAMTAAHTLAHALAGSPGRVEEALRGYETEHRKLVMPKQRRVGLAAGMLVPATRLGLTTRNVAARWMGRAA